jgi:predicted MFS family arabinose efflux permease/HAMP domain-containing protein
MSMTRPSRSSVWTGWREGAGMRLDATRPLFVRLLLLAVIVLVPPVVLLSLDSLGEFGKRMVPEMDKKAEAVGRDIAASVERAVGLGIPLGKLVGVDEFFAPVLTANPEIRYLVVTDDDGRVLFANGADAAVLEPHYRSADLDAEGERRRKSNIEGFIDLALPVASKGVRVGQVHVGVDEGFVRGRLQEIIVDISVVMLASLLVAFEILLFVVTFNITGPMRVLGSVIDKVRRGDFTTAAGVASEDEVGRFVRAFNAAIRHADDGYRRLEAYFDEVKTAHFDQSVVERVADIEARVRFLFRFSPNGQPEVANQRQATDIRLPLFLFVFAEEISRSFMPLYLRDSYAPISGLSPEMAIAVPIAVFMACIAFASPWAAVVTNRVGSRAVFLAGLVPATLGFVMTAIAHNLYDLILWRAVTAIGYAGVTMACQGYIAQVSQHEKRAQGLGIYVGAVLTASVCGTGIGGVLAERIGYRATFVAAAVLVLLSGWLIHRLMEPARPTGERFEPTRRDFLALLRNWRFTALVVFAAIPSKIALTAFFFFLVPLWLAQQPGFDLGDIARYMMAYPVVVVVLSPLAARLADRGGKAGLVALGGLIGGGALLMPLLMPGTVAVLAGIMLLGVSHGLSASPQLAMIPDICWTECRNIGQTNVLAFLRFAERLGSIVGPLLAAAFIQLYGYSGAIVAVGLVVLAMSAVFAVLSFAYHAGPHIQAEEVA